MTNSSRNRAIGTAVGAVMGAALVISTNPDSRFSMSAPAPHSAAIDAATEACVRKRGTAFDSWGGDHSTESGCYEAVVAETPYGRERTQFEQTVYSTGGGGAMGAVLGLALVSGVYRLIRRRQAPATPVIGG